jgi:hypothetical protein
MAVSRHLLSFAASSFAIALVCARASAQTAAQSLAFDVASIHINNTETDGGHHIFNNPAESHLRTRNLALRDLIQFAYGLPNSQPSIFTAIQEQLGLKLESSRGPVPVLVIDSVAMPSAN